MTVEQQTRLTTDDGIELHARLATVEQPRAVMLLCHGMTTDCSEHGAFPVLRDRALAAGLAVARFDFRAHGASGGTNEQLRISGERKDADTVMDWVTSELGPDLPVIPLGVSFGGGAAIHIASTRNCAGLVLWYAVVDYYNNYNGESAAAFTHLMREARSDRDPPWAELPVLGTDYYIPYELIAETPTDPTYEQLSALTVPVLSYNGSRDTFIDPEPVRKLATRNQNIDRRMAWGAGHGFILWRWWVVRETVAFAVRAAARARQAAPTG